MRHIVLYGQIALIIYNTTSIACTLVSALLAEYSSPAGTSQRQQRQARGSVLLVRAAGSNLQEAEGTLGRAGDTLVKKNTVLVVGATGTLGRQVCPPQIGVTL